MSGYSTPITLIRVGEQVWFVGVMRGGQDGRRGCMGLGRNSGEDAGAGQSGFMKVSIYGCCETYFLNAGRKKRRCP